MQFVDCVQQGVGGCYCQHTRSLCFASRCGSAWQWEGAKSNRAMVLRTCLCSYPPPVTVSRKFLPASSSVPFVSCASTVSRSLSLARLSIWFSNVVSGNCGPPLPQFQCPRRNSGVHLLCEFQKRNTTNWKLLLWIASSRSVLVKICCSVDDSDFGGSGGCDVDIIFFLSLFFVASAFVVRAPFFLSFFLSRARECVCVRLLLVKHFSWAMPELFLPSKF